MAARTKTDYPGVYYYTVPRIGGPGDERSYYVIFKQDKKVHEEPVGRQFRDAMTPAKAARIRASMIEGKRELAAVRRERVKAEQDAEANRPTLTNLWQVYKSKKIDTRSLRCDDGRFVRHIAPMLGSKVPADLVTLDADRLRVKLLKSHSPQTAKHVLALLKRIIRFGVRAGLIDPPNPKRFNIEMPTFDNPKTETLSNEQLSALLKAAAADENQKAGALVLLALATGLRRLEMLRLKWQDVDLDGGFIKLPRTKAGKVQHVPLNEMSREVLAGIPKTAEHVFPGGKDGEHVQNVYPALRRIRARAGLPSTMRPLHACRHVFASRLASAGATLYMVQTLLRHSDGRMTQRYSHLTDKALVEVSDKAASIMRDAQNGVAPADAADADKLSA